MLRRHNLKKFLSKYNEWTCPDNYYFAWRMLFLEDKKDRRVIRQAEEDMREEEKLRLQHNFNRDRRKMKDIGKRKYNWY